MKSFNAVFVFASTSIGLAACGGRTDIDLLSNGESGLGGNASGETGGSAASGNSSSLGGAINMGGFIATGGLPIFTGGRASAGGYIGTGGARPIGGYGPILTGGRAPTGGTQSTGGTATTGGAKSLAGATASAGTGPIGGKVGVGGAPFTGGGKSTGGTVSLGGATASAGTSPIGGKASVGGSTTAGGTSNTGGTSSCPVLVGPNEDLIDNMDHGTSSILPNPNRRGNWTDFHDASSAPMFPVPNSTFTMTYTGDVCRQYAAYVYGGPFSISGANFGFGLGAPYDASAYKGFSFWAKMDGGTGPYLRVAFPDKDTDPTAGICSANATVPSQQCWDHFGGRVTLSTVWTKYVILFSGLTQDGWGYHAAAFDPTTLFSVTFEIPANAIFGIWVDDVAFTY